MLGRRADLAERLWPEKLQELQDAFSRSYAVPILVVEVSGRPLAACEDLSQFCRRFTRRVPLSRPCLECGRAEHADEAAQVVYDPVRREPAVHHCPLGLADIAAPIWSAGETIGYLLSPQFVVARREQENASNAKRQQAEQTDEWSGWLARCPSTSMTQLLQIESGLVAASWLLGALASAKRRNLRLAERIREQSRSVQELMVTDAVTGLVNHRRLMEALAAEVRRARRYRRPLSLAVIEVQSFREINDEFGHTAGDAALASLAHCLTSTLRQTDMTGRVSADSFGVILPETMRSQALAAMQRVGGAVDDLNAAGDHPVEIRLACGIVDEIAEPEEMLRAAREAVALARTVGAPAMHAV